MCGVGMDAWMVTAGYRTPGAGGNHGTVALAITMGLAVAVTMELLPW